MLIISNAGHLISKEQKRIVQVICKRRGTYLILRYRESRSLNGRTLVVSMIYVSYIIGDLN